MKKFLIEVSKLVMLVLISLTLCGQVDAKEKILYQQKTVGTVQSTNQPMNKQQSDSQKAMETRILKKLQKSITFPSPKYDSGWLKSSRINILEPEATKLTHNVGGNVDRYFVDIQIKYKDPKIGISNQNIGSSNGHYLVDYCKIQSDYKKSGCVHSRAAYPYFRDIKGAYYTKLTNRNISVRISPGSDEKNNLGAIDAIRVRIWTY